MGLSALKAGEATLYNRSLPQAVFHYDLNRPRKEWVCLSVQVMMSKSQKLSAEQEENPLAATRGQYSDLTLGGWGNVLFTIDLDCWEMP